jgi:long-chain acyl-CoA synthetase
LVHRGTVADGTSQEGIDMGVGNVESAGLWTLARTHPHELALADDRRQLTRSAVAEEVNRSANALLALGLAPDARIAVFAENSAETVMLYTAARVAGVGAVVVNFHLGGEELEYILEKSESVVVWVDATTVGVALEAATRVGGVTVVSTGPPLEGTISWESLVGEADPTTPSLERPATFELVFTSGTTGYPKAVRNPPAPPGTVRELLTNLSANPLSRGGPHLTVGPLYHSGPHSAAVGALLSGSPLVVLGRFDAEATLRAIQQYEIATTIMVPTHFVRMLALPTEVRERYDVSSLTLVGHTGSSCPVSVKAAMIEWFGPVLLEAYGSTEAGTVASITSEEWLLHPGSVGRVADGYGVTVVDEDGETVGPGTEGRLCFSAPGGRMIKYHDDTEAAKEAYVRPSLFTIGEIGWVDEDGYIYITDRLKDMVVSGGANIYPAECERVLLDHPGVLDAAVFGIPDPEMGERLIGLVVARQPGLRAEELVDYARNRLAHYKVPRTIELVDDIPRSAMGKINKRQIRDWYLEDSEA